MTGSMDTPVLGFSHIQLMVSDVTASCDWYSKVLGVEPMTVADDGRYVALQHRPSHVVIVLTRRADPWERRRARRAARPPRVRGRRRRHLATVGRSPHRGRDRPPRRHPRARQAVAAAPRPRRHHHRARRATRQLSRQLPPKCGLTMKPTIAPCGDVTVAVTMPSPTSAAGVCTVAPPATASATAASTSSTPQ